MSSQKGVRKEVNRGPTLKFYCRPKAQEETAFWKVAFLLSSLFFPRKYSDNNFGQLPPLPPSSRSDGGAVRIRELLSERILVISAPPSLWHKTSVSERPTETPPPLSGVIRANRFARFARVG